MYPEPMPTSQIAVKFRFTDFTMGLGIVVRLGYLRSWIIITVTMDRGVSSSTARVRYVALYLILVSELTSTIYSDFISMPDTAGQKIIENPVVKSKPFFMSPSNPSVTD